MRGEARGFTLVEVLVALLVMAVMATMAWQGVDGIVRAKSASEGQVDRVLRLNTVLAQWEQDLAAIEDTDVVPALTFDGSALTAKDANLAVNGASTVRAGVSNSAAIVASGPATVSFSGNPSCTSQLGGSASVTGCRKSR